MGVYIISLFTMWAFGFLGRHIDEDNKLLEERSAQSIRLITSKMAILFSFSAIWLVAALRVNVGTDFKEYAKLFNRYITMPWFYKFDIEPLFFYFNKLIGVFTNNSQWLFAVSSFIICFLYYKISIKESAYFELSMFLFVSLGFYTSSLNTMRQWVACSIVFYSYKYIFEKDFKRFIGFVLVAILFHYSAIIVIPVYFFTLKVKEDKIRIFIMVVSTIGGFLTGRILNALTYIISISKIPNKYSIYVNSFASNNARFYVFPIFCIIVFIGYVLTKDKLSDINENIDFHINILVVAYSISILGQRLYLFSRMQYYFMPILIILIPNIIGCFKGKSKVAIYNMILILGFLFMLYQLSRNGGEPLPYKSIFGY